MGDRHAIVRALKSIPVIELRGMLVRMVPLGDLAKNSPPDFLFTSGKPNRYNPDGIECVYFSENESTAHLEYAQQWTTLRAGRQPVVTYFAEVRLHRVLDLACRKTLQNLKLTPYDLYKPWRGAEQPTVSQMLGQTIAEHSNISAIRYRSVAAELAGKSGFNIVIYRNNVKRPNSLRILGPDRNSLGTWP